jgi:hypothetical protein
MKISKATFDKPFEGAEPVWALRVEVEGEEFIHRALPVVAQVGNVRVESIVVNMAGDGFVGLLRSVPPVGAELKVGYADSKLIETGITFNPPIG